ncbi:hypothetical protein HDU99_008527 [Rhizoclosmatium hyalinum]|nr:hypothetical protein HDU99_008527 [Rhizoclosmatium hyalinum]
MPIDATNVALAAISVVLVVVYHVWLVSVVRSAPHKTVYGVNGLSRKAWVATIMRGKNKDILAVQSLRNLIMASSILGSTCVVIIFGFIAFLATVVSHPETTDSKGNPLGSQFGFVLDDLFGPKVMTLLVVFCVAFFCFAQSMRFYNHVGLVINIQMSAEELEEAFHLSPSESSTDDCDHHDEPSGPVDLVRTESHASMKLEFPNKRSRSPERGSIMTRLNHRGRLSESQRRQRHLNVHALAANIEFVARMLNRGSMYYTFGMRGYYISFPVMAYLWGPWALFGTTILLIVILRAVDFNLETLSPTLRGAAEKSKLNADAKAVEVPVGLA